MSLEVRPVANEAEHLRYRELSTIAFGAVPSPPSADDEALQDRLRDRGREMVVVEDERVLGGFFAYDLRVTLPGGADVPAGGLAGVAVDPGRIGQGLLGRMVQAHLADARRRGEVVSILTASESGLYRRYGYGWATSYAVLDATASEARLDPLPDRHGLELVADHATARALAAEAYQRIATTRAGTVSRPGAWWEAVYASQRTWLGGGSQFTVVHRDADGHPDGYLLYVIDLAGGGAHGVPAGTVQVRELLGVSPDVELALWDHAVRVPLTRHVRWELAPVDTPVRWGLRDPRQLRTVAWRDLLWLRVLDLPAVLERRSYVLGGQIDFEVRGPADDPVSGPWRLEVADGRGTVGPGGRPQLSLGIADLGATVLGGVGLAELASAGRVTGDGDAIARLGLLLATPTQPFSLSRF